MKLEFNPALYLKQTAYFIVIKNLSQIQYLSNKTYISVV
jgi:hypothetical protein